MTPFIILDSVDFIQIPVTDTRVYFPASSHLLGKNIQAITLNTELDGEFCLFGEQLYLKPKCIDVDKIKVVRNGLNLGIYRKNRFEPSYALCLALKKEDFKNTVDFECDSEELKKYLMGNTVECDKKGWCAVTVNGYPIGWGKASNGILKNHFPKYLRLKR